jgi:hypothetical protein
MSNRISKGRYGDDNDPKIIEAERRRSGDADEQFNQLPEFMSRPEAFNDPKAKTSSDTDDCITLPFVAHAV